MEESFEELLTKVLEKEFTDTYHQTLSKIKEFLNDKNLSSVECCNKIGEIIEILRI